MGATKTDTSGVFSGDPQLRMARSSMVARRDYRLDHNGMSFRSDVSLKEWSEVSVKMRFSSSDPATGHRKQEIGCHAVVVQCSSRGRAAGYDVVLLFLDLPQRSAARLDTLAQSPEPMSISIAH